MKLHKTHSRKRDTYTFDFFDANGKPKPVTVRPGENGVTEIDIKILHSFDDSEVYYNIKNRRPKLEDWQLKQIAEWESGFITFFSNAHGYSPSKDDLMDAKLEVFPKNWIGSLDEMLDTENYGYGDKSALLYSLSSETTDEPSYIERLHEIIEGMDKRWQFIYEQALLEGIPKTEVAAVLNISEARVRQIVRKIEARIAEDKILKKLFK